MPAVQSTEMRGPAGIPRRRGARGATPWGPALAVTALALAVLTTPALSAGGRTIHGLATARLRLAQAEGSTLVETGPVSGVIVGQVQARLKTGASYTGEFTMKTASGSIKGVGRAKPSMAGRYQSFRGSFRVVGGSGRYAHIHGEAALYGVFDRRTDSVVVQTLGTLAY
jgi:hypothetical protein